MPAPESWDELRYVVVSTQLITPVITELRLRPRAAAMSYLPGQYVPLRDGNSATPQRSYSIANEPRSDGLLHLLVTYVLDGATSNWVHDRLDTSDAVPTARSSPTQPRSPWCCC
jgi:ferredoxin-NADP reductase